MPDSEPFLLDAFGPLPVVQPGAVAELRDLVRRASSQGMAIYPFGGRTMLNYGLPPTRPGHGVDFRQLDEVIDFPARDMTITVQAGITVRRLQEIAAAENLGLPVDVPLAERATLGGAIATNVSGPRRYGFGTMRDYVIGITVINDEGQETKAGGRVVKNVAGYDLCKLHVGALGTLGVITQATLKLKPLPERSRMVVLACKSHLTALLDRLHMSRARPVFVTVVSPKASAAICQTGKGSDSLAQDDWIVLVGLEGNEEAIAWQAKQLDTEVSHLCVPLSIIGANAISDSTWRSLVDFPLSEPASVTFKANVLPSAMAAFCENLIAFGSLPVMHAHAGSGIVIGHLDPAMTREEAVRLIRRIIELTVPQGGNLTLLRCPPAWKKDLPIWGEPRSDSWLMRVVKDKLDPRGIFNPGRFVAGI
jgi:glycolate oxidase FAD binding subunit